jgi:DNA polymerase I
MNVTPTTYEPALRRLQGAKRLTVDLETTGLDTWHGDRMVGVAVRPDSDEPYYFAFRHGEGPNLEPHLAPPLYHVILGGAELRGHNFIRFDTRMLVKEDPGFTKLLREDTIPRVDSMILAQLVNENEPTFKLKALADKYLRPDASASSQRLDALLASKGLDKGSMWKLPAADVAEYACDDTILADDLIEHQWPTMERYGTVALAHEMFRYARLLSRMEYTGLRIDRDLMAQYREETVTMRDGYLAQIQAAAGYDINPRSPKQLCAWLDLPSTNKATLEAASSPHAELLKLYRQCEKVIGTYYDPILELCDADGILHPQLNLTRDSFDEGGTRSGRLSCSKPNFQALPKSNAIYRVRDCVLPPLGCRWGAHDYERAEVWLAGSYSLDEPIVRAYHENRDLYEEMATQCHLTRFQAKVLFLMIQYGAGGALVAQKFNWTRPEADAVRKRIRGFIPRVSKLMWELSDQVKEAKAMRLWTGRVLHFDGELSLYYTAWNRLIQGGVGEMVRLAMQRLEPMLDSLGGELVLQVHDEIAFYAPEDRIDEAMRESAHVMEDFPNFALPPRVDGKTGPTFGHYTPHPRERMAA